MKKISKVRKHLLILKRRIQQRSELKELSALNNKSMENVLKAFDCTKSNTHQKEDLISFSKCENHRKNLLFDNTEISYKTFSMDKTALVRDICREAPSSKKWCQFLYYLVKFVDNPVILEIGTNLGISGSYMLEAMKNKQGKFITMEGLPQLCEISARQFSTITPKSKFEVVQGLYDDTFPAITQNGLKYNLIFIDGNHKKEPTIEYFKALKSSIGHSAIFVFDDIYWSNGMTEAWNIIKDDPDVNFSIDMFEQGIVIIDKSEPVHNEQFELHLAY